MRAVLQVGYAEFEFGSGRQWKKAHDALVSYVHAILCEGEARCTAFLRPHGPALEKKTRAFTAW
jgi:hypothetical protein